MDLTKKEMDLIEEIVQRDIPYSGRFYARKGIVAYIKSISSGSSETQAVRQNEDAESNNFFVPCGSGTNHCKCKSVDECGYR